MSKKYGKAIEQPQGTLPLRLHSEQMDGQSRVRRRPARALVLSGPLLHLPKGWGAFAAPTATFPIWILPGPIQGMRAAKRGRAPVTGGSLKQKAEEPGGSPHQALLLRGSLGSLTTGWRSSAAPGRLTSPSHFTSWDLNMQTYQTRHLSVQSWPTPRPLRRQMIQDREAEPSGCVIQKQGYGQRDFRNKFNFGFPTFSDHKN